MRALLSKEPGGPETLVMDELPDPVAGPGQVIVADGTPEAAKRIERVLTTDPGMGIIRHADAGYPEAIEFARRRGVAIPMSKEEEGTAADLR